MYTYYNKIYVGHFSVVFSNISAHIRWSGLYLYVGYNNNETRAVYYIYIIIEHRRRYI